MKMHLNMSRKPLGYLLDPKTLIFYAKLEEILVKVSNPKNPLKNIYVLSRPNSSQVYIHIFPIDRLSFKGGCWPHFFATLDIRMHKHALLRTCFDMRTVIRRKKSPCGHAAPEHHTFKKEFWLNNDRDVAKKRLVRNV